MMHDMAIRQRIAAIAGDAIAAFVLEQGYDRAGSIPEAMTFRDWCEQLGERGLKVDHKPFTLVDRPAMHMIYDLIPSTPAAAKGRTVVMMKCAQVGFTVMEMLAAIYMLLKFEPVSIGMFLPDAKLASVKSSVRFMPIIRLVPAAYKRLIGEDAVSGERKTGEGNVLTRQVGGSVILFLWTSGKAMTESMPMDVLSFDEVQNMLVEDMEKTNERLSASAIKFKLMGSTANWPDADIHYWFKRGTQLRFHTRCRACDGTQIMDDHFPPAEGKRACIGYDEAEREYRYQCVHCEAWIDDAQDGEWIADNPEAMDEKGRGIESIHFPQFLSPTITPRELYESYHNATSIKNWFNRKMGKPWTDPSQIPVNLTHLHACVEAGKLASVAWKKAAKGTFMGVDNMGGYSCAIILERHKSGAMVLIHAEQIHALDPWARLDVLMRDFGVVVCCCEQLPNYDSAKQFASRHSGRVFLVAAYKPIDDDMMRWGDATVSAADRKTDSEHRDRYTVTLDQYKMMDWSFARITKRLLWMPEPRGLQQDILVKGENRRVELLSEVLWVHFMKTALATEVDKDEHKMTRMVKKIAIDPHFSFALMLACAAWCRSYGSNHFLLPDVPEPGAAVAAVQAAMPGLPADVLRMVGASAPGTCGACTAFLNGRCQDRDLNAGASDPACDFFNPRPRNA